FRRDRPRTGRSHHGGAHDLRGARSPAPGPRRGGAVIGEVDDLLAHRERWRSEGKTVVWTNGCFDLLHIGHLRSLEGARAQGDVLVVGVNDDASVRELKGPDRPAVPEDERLELVAALKPVDHVVVLRATTPVDAIARLQPDIHCKGADYAPGQ